MLCLVNQGSQVRIPASPEPLSIEPLGVSVIKYTHKPSQCSTGYCPGKSHIFFGGGGGGGGLVGGGRHLAEVQITTQKIWINLDVNKS